MTRINWNASREDAAIIERIARRAVNEAASVCVELDLLETEMDVTACHLNGCPLRLVELLEADAFNFSHDLVGIHNNMDRTTGKLTGHFLPRFAQPQKSAALEETA